MLGFPNLMQPQVIKPKKRKSNFLFQKYLDSCYKSKKDKVIKRERKNKRINKEYLNEIVKIKLEPLMLGEL